MTQFTFIDMFAGAGGFSEGLLLAQDHGSQFKLVAASDHQQNACLTHQHRFCHQLHLDYDFWLADIRSEELPQKLIDSASKYTSRSTIDVLVGGPPCQGFSVFGLRKEEDPRNDLFHPYLRLIQILKPKYFVMENVPGLEMMYGGKTVTKIYEEVAKIGPEKYTLHGPLKVTMSL